MTSALIKFFSKSVWIAADAFCAVESFLIGHARTSIIPAVKKFINPSFTKQVREILSKPDSAIPKSFRKVIWSSIDNDANSDSILALTQTVGLFLKFSEEFD